MSNTTKPKYLKGSAKQVSFNNGGSIINISLKKSEIAELPDTNDYVKISVIERRETDQYGNTHYVIENTYQPKSDSPAPTRKPDAPSRPSNNKSEDDLPF